MFIHLKILLAILALLLQQNLLAQEINNNIKKVLFINSYHNGYAWSDGIQSGIEAVLLTKKSILLKTIEMDTKHNTSEDFKIKAALKVKKYIEKFKPNVVIAADDNASKYVIEPYYKDSNLPVVFCGVNWDTSVYGYPYSNATGMIEVSLANQIVKYLKKYATGNKIGFISGDVITARKELKYHKKLLNIDYNKTYFVKTFKEWQTKYLQLQQEVDMIFFNNNAGIKDWEDKEAQKFILENTKAFTGSQYDFMAPLVAITIAKIAEEQGSWSAQTALKILAGNKANKIKIVKNKDGKLIFNMKLINKLGIKIPLSTLKIAEIIK
jgi:ABC-type uncharacterized transport system substrate-binding protein